MSYMGGGGEKFSKIQALLVNSRDFVLRDKTGKFPDYPDDDEGGSAAIFKEKDPAEVTFKSFSQWWIQGRGLGPPYFQTKLRTKGPKKKFFETESPPRDRFPAPPPSPLIWRSGPATVSCYCIYVYLWLMLLNKSLMSIFLFNIFFADGKRRRTGIYILLQWQNIRKDSQFIILFSQWSYTHGKCTKKWDPHEEVFCSLNLWLFNVIVTVALTGNSLLQK